MNKYIKWNNFFFKKSKENQGIYLRDMKSSQPDEEENDLLENYTLLNIFILQFKEKTHLAHYFSSFF